MRLEHLDFIDPIYPLPVDDLTFISIFYPDVRCGKGCILSVDEVLEKAEVKEYIERINNWMELFRRVSPEDRKLDSYLFEEIQVLLIEKLIINKQPDKQRRESKAKMFIRACRESFRGRNRDRAQSIDELLKYAVSNKVPGYSPIEIDGDKVKWLSGSSTKKALRTWFKEDKGR